MTLIELLPGNDAIAGGDYVIQRPTHRVKGGPDEGFCDLHHHERAVALFYAGEDTRGTSCRESRVADSPRSTRYVFKGERFVQPSAGQKPGAAGRDEAGGSHFRCTGHGDPRLDWVSGGTEDWSDCCQIRPPSLVCQGVGTKSLAGHPCRTYSQTSCSNPRQRLLADLRRSFS